MFMQVGSTLHAGDVKIPAYIWLFGTVAADLLITVISKCAWVSPLNDADV